MRRTSILSLALLAGMAVPPAGMAASDSRQVDANITVTETLLCGASWVSNGNPTINVSTPTNASVVDQIFLDCTSNGPNPTSYSISSNVLKSAGPAWVETVALWDPSSQYLVWTQATFGTPQSFTATVTGTPGFTQTYPASFNVATTQAFATYSFSVRLTATSL